MPIKLADRKSAVKSLAIDVSGETLNVTYRPGAITWGWDRSVRAAEKSAEPELDIAGLFAQVIVSWDIEGDDGQPVPIEAETLLNVPSDILLAVLKAVRSDGAPGEQPAATSRGSF